MATTVRLGTTLLSSFHANLSSAHASSRWVVAQAVHSEACVVATMGAHFKGAPLLPGPPGPSQLRYPCPDHN
jgi:hypothetical protein